MNYLAPTYYRNYILPIIDLQVLFDQKYAPKQMPEVPTANTPEVPKRIGRKR
ncbi:hypothetical protein Hsw_PB0038 (plasmid) [Hymenobacter swuensis DY53]|uniref:Uncharacterized protein n=1 Tax=Hymenobacter swuensis DY53 TaxID=1227739 RepID=W8ERW1_9BACT|nr:hypothetical protein Hsw_PB0038 [Hymenobacter swuensis DY53]